VYGQEIQSLVTPRQELRTLATACEVLTIGALVEPMNNPAPAVPQVSTAGVNVGIRIGEEPRLPPAVPWEEPSPTVIPVQITSDLARAVLIGGEWI
jgi:hypothetical protein